MTWQCTNEMRWLEKKVVQQTFVNVNAPYDIVRPGPAKVTTTLQQKYISNTGEEKWVDVPTVKEHNNDN